MCKGQVLEGMRGAHAWKGVGSLALQQSRAWRGSASTASKVYIEGSRGLTGQILEGGEGDSGHTE